MTESSRRYDREACSSKEGIIGGGSEKVDALAKVTGETKFVEDIIMPGMLYASVLRSSHYHARLISLDTEPAESCTGVVKVIVAEDIPGINGFPEYSQNEPLLTPVNGVVKTLGAPVALVVADTQEIARCGMKLIEAKYQPLAETVSIDQALEEQPLIYKEGNVLKDYQKTMNDIDIAMSQSDVVVKARYSTSFQEHSALEREAVVGYIGDRGCITVMGGTHEPHWQRNWIADVLDLDRSMVRFITPPIGGSFGGKQDPWLHLAVGLMVFLVRRPVRLTYSREESFVASPKRHLYDLDYEIGSSNSGKLTGIKVRIKANTGGYDSAGSHIPNYAVTAGGGPYNWSAADIHAESVYTNAPKCGQFRGFGTPQATFGLECSLDELIEKLDEDPIDFRLNNCISQFTDTYMGYPVAETLGFVEVLEAVRPKYLEIYQEVNKFNAEASSNLNTIASRMGVGVAGMWYRFGKSGSLIVKVRAELSQDGGIYMYCSAPDYGQGTSTVMQQLSAETLGLPRECVTVVNADTGNSPDSGVQGASRATYWVGKAVCDAAENLKKAIKTVSAELLDCHPAELSMTAGSVICSSHSNKRISFSDLAKEFDKLGKSRIVNGKFDLSPLFPNRKDTEYTPHFVTGVHIAEVTVDTHTGAVSVERMVAAHDVGKAINPPGARGQVEGSIMMGLGAALTEEYIPGRSTGFSEYILPMATEMPQMDVILVEVPSRKGPYGAKGVGETGVLASTPAIINAVSRAIGTRIRRIPATPPRVLKALNEMSYKGND